MKTAKIKDLKKGEYVKRTKDAKRVFKRGEYNRSTKKFELHPVDDIYSAIEFKGNTVVFYDFEY